MSCRVHIHLFVLATIGCPCAGKLIMKPRDIDVKVNQSTYFNCSTDHGSTDIFWFHGANHVYAGNAILELYHERFKIDRNVGNGTYIYNLVIHSVQPGDAGQYICAEDEGVGQKYSAELIVLDGDPICQSNVELDKVIGQNTCNVELDEVELSCSGTYHGNIPPQMEWRKVGDENKIAEGLANVTSGKHYSCILKLKGDISLGNSSYVCQTARITKEPCKCISKVINVLYALSDNSTVNKTINDKILCRANTTQSCSYKWRWFKDNDVTTESSSEILTPKKPGLHQCEAECYLRNEACKLLVLQAMIFGETDASLGPGYVTLIVIVVVLASCVVIISVLLNRSRKRRMAKRNERIREMQMTEPDGIVEDINEIPKRCTKQLFIDKGSTGDVYGPFVFQNINCACEQILLPSAKVLSATEAEVCGPGRLWMELDNSNVLKFYGVLFHPPALYVVMDYAEGGSVRKALNSCREDLEISVVKDWATQIADGMNYLHCKEIIHGGLKAAQILIMEPFDPTNPSPRTLTIASYRLTMESGQSVQLTFKGMFAWMAPEAIRGEKICKANDVWSYGVTVWEILTRAIPHMGVKQVVLIKDLCEGSRTLTVPSRCPNSLGDILNECWERDKNRRPTFSHIVSRLHAIADC